MCAFDKDDELEDAFEAHVRKRTALMEKGRAERGRSFWSYMGLIGTIGWTVVLPMLLGVFIGLRLDARFETGSKWTLSLLVAGLSAGCYNAWRFITREH
jgi:ATP synthase protein I